MLSLDFLLQRFRAFLVALDFSTGIYEFLEILTNSTIMFSRNAVLDLDSEPLVLFTLLWQLEYLTLISPLFPPRMCEIVYKIIDMRRDGREQGTFIRPERYTGPIYTLECSNVVLISFH